MRPLRWPGVVGLIAFVIGGCGGSEPAVPTAQELAATLLQPDDLTGAWSVTEVPDDVGMPSPGVVPEDLQQSVPSFDLCDAAGDDAEAAMGSLRWLAFQQLDLAVDDPIEPPDRHGHMVFVQEALTAGESDEIRSIFEALRGGLTACIGDIAAGEEGPGTLAAASAPEVGDDRVAFLTTVEEAGGWAEWRLHQVLVRDGTTLMLLTITDIRAGDDVDPYFSGAELDQIVETAVARW